MLLFHDTVLALLDSTVLGFGPTALFSITTYFTVLPQHGQACHSMSAQNCRCIFFIRETNTNNASVVCDDVLAAWSVAIRY